MPAVYDYEPLTGTIQPPRIYDKLTIDIKEVHSSHSTSNAASTRSAYISAQRSPHLLEDLHSVQDQEGYESIPDCVASCTDGSGGLSEARKIASPSAAVRPSPRLRNVVLDIPSDISELTVDQVGQCLRQLHLEKHVDVFQQQDVDGQLLTSLDEDILVTDFAMSRFNALKLMKFAREGWRPRFREHRQETQ